MDGDGGEIIARGGSTDRLAYSARSESIGFTWGARMDGTRLATRVTLARITAAAARVMGSRGKQNISALAALAATRQGCAQHQPGHNKVAAFPRIMAVMPARGARSAIRMPTALFVRLRYRT